MEDANRGINLKQVPSAEVLLFTQQVTPDDYRALIGMMTELPSALDGGDKSYDRVLDWQDKLLRKTEGSSLQQCIEGGLVFIPDIMDTLEMLKWRRLTNKTNPGVAPGNEYETVDNGAKKEWIKFMREMAGFVSTIRHDTKAMEIACLQIKYLESAFKRFALSLSYDPSRINGLRGTIAGVIAFQDLGYDVCWPPIEMDLRDDIDQIVISKSGQRLGLSLKCSNTDEVTVQGLSLAQKGIDVRRCVDKVVSLVIPTPSRRFDLWDNELVPSQFLVSDIRDKIKLL